MLLIAQHEDVTASASTGLSSATPCKLTRHCSAAATETSQPSADVISEGMDMDIDMDESSVADTDTSVATVIYNNGITTAAS